jgi:hypothetical protein
MVRHTDDGTPVAAQLADTRSQEHINVRRQPSQTIGGASTDSNGRVSVSAHPSP